jgi:hypothetical protein
MQAQPESGKLVLRPSRIALRSIQATNSSWCLESRY